MSNEKKWIAFLQIKKFRTMFSADLQRHRQVDWESNRQTVRLSQADRHAELKQINRKTDRLADKLAA